MCRTLASFPGPKRRPGNEARWRCVCSKTICQKTIKSGIPYPGVRCVQQSDYCEVSGCGSGPSQEVFKHMLQCTPHNSVAVVIVSCWPTMSVLCKKWSHPRRKWLETITTTSHVMEWPTRYSVCFVSANNESLIFPLIWLPYHALRCMCACGGVASQKTYPGFTYFSNEQ